MKHISFNWTTAALLAGRKTATCRQWTPEYARRFKAEDRCLAYDRQARFGGKPVAVIELAHGATMGDWRDILTDPYEQEGFAWYDEQVAVGNAAMGSVIRDKLGIPAGMTIKDWLATDPNWGACVIRFRLVEVLP